MEKNDIQFWLGFNRMPGLGPIRFAMLEKHFGSMETAWHAPASELRAAGLDDRTVQTIVARRPTISPSAETESLERQSVSVINWNDASYPALLREVYDKPPLLYFRGSLEALGRWPLAVVGTRRPSAYGRQAAEEIVTDLSRNGVSIVSGLARGIDSIAHRAALNAGGHTIAVFASGLDIVYPPENASLAREVAETGCLVSEYPLGTRPRADYFPRRNRILSGLSLGVLVVEAGDHSGALWTSSWALEQNREVFAVPGSIYSPQSRGTNQLIQQGAKLVHSYANVLEEFNLTTAVKQVEMTELWPANESEASLLKQLSAQPLHIDELCRQSHLPVAAVSSNLAMMELKGLVKQVGNMSYVLTREVREQYSTKVE